MNVTLNDQGRKEFYFGWEEVKPGCSARIQAGETKLLLLGLPGLWLAPCRTWAHWDQAPLAVLLDNCWTIPCPMETPGNYIQSWHEGVQRQDSDKWHIESNLPIRTNQTLSPHAEAPSQHFISAAPSLGIVQTDCSSSHCSDTRQGTLLDNVVLGNSALCEASGTWSFVSAPAGAFSSADYLTCCTTQDSASLEPNHRAFTEQPPVQTDTRHSFWTWQPQLHGDFATFIREAFEKQK